MDKKTIRDIALAGKKVLTRVDFNVPLDEKSGHITDDSRIKAAIPTIDYLIDNNARVILCSHLGRPKGKVEPIYSLKEVAKRLAEILRQPVEMAPDCIGVEVENMANNLKNGEVLLLENLRFHTEEEQNEAEFALSLARLGDIYINDAFGTAHRPHASIVGVTQHMPAVAGFLLEKEINALGNILQNPVHPFGLLLGGAKVNDKVGMIENVMPKVDHIIIGGGMAATFLKAKSYEVGQSLLDGNVATAAYLMQKAEKNGVKIYLPEDVVVVEVGDSEMHGETVPINRIPENTRIVDIGALTISRFTRALEKCKTVFWNGPMGIYEIPRFSEGTKAMAHIIANLHAATIIGGGSTAEVVIELKLNERMSFVSTGGGASLKFLSGEILPGVAVLMNQDRS
jgi:phosphoglycerate kinase